MGQLVSAMFLSAFLFFLPTVSLSQPAPDQAAAKKKVLLLHSYYSDYPWTNAITEGVQEILPGQDVELEIFYMDTKRKTSQEWKVKSGEMAIKKIDEWQPDVVIASDDNAQIYVTQNYAGKAKPYIVFCGVNANPADYGFPASNVTGILERPNMDAAIKFLKAIYPTARRVAVISDTDPTSRGTLEYLSENAYDIRIIKYHLIKDFDTWKDRINFYNIEADAIFIYMYHTIRAGEEAVSIPPEEVLKWTVANAKVPLVGFFDFAVEGGMLCGAVESGREFGQEAAKMAMELLQGKDIKDIPVKISTVGIRMLNMSTARRLGIAVPEDVLPTIEKVFE